MAFLIEDTNERLGCLLNPEGLVIRRAAGVRAATMLTGQLTGTGLSDDPLVFTGGGRTEIDLDLLFDVGLAGSSIRSEDVRDLTGPLWRLAENTRNRGGFSRPAAVRFIWGKSWNIPGVVVAVAERLEHFSAAGVPGRSWLRMRMLRVSEPPPGRSRAAAAVPALAAGGRGPLQVAYQVVGGAPASPLATPVFELAALAPEPSIGGSMVTAARIIWEALSETNAGRAIGRACRAIAGAVEAARSHVAAWLASDSGFFTRLGERIGGALSTVSSAVSGVLRAAHTRLVSATRAAVNAIQTAAGRLARAVRRAVGAAAEAVRSVVNAATRAVRRAALVASEALAEAMAPIIADMRSVGRALGQAAAVVTVAVRARAVHFMATAARHLEAAAGRGRQALDAIGAALAPAAQRAAAAMRTALDAVAGGASEVLRAGRTVAQGIPAALAQMAHAAEQLWSAGQRAAAGVFRGVVGGMALAYRGLAAGAEALRAVELRPLAIDLRAQAATIRTRLAAPGSLDEEEREELAGAADELAATAGQLAVGAAPPVPGQPPALAVPAAEEELPAAAAPETAEEPAPEAAPEAEEELTTGEVPEAEEELPTGEVPESEEELPAVAVPEAEAEPAPETAFEAEAAAPGPADELSVALAEVRGILDAPEVGAEEADQVIAGLERIEAAGADVVAAVEAQVGESLVSAAESTPAQPEVEPEWPAAPQPVGRAAGSALHVTEGERLDLIAHRYYGDAAYWRTVAIANQIADPLRIPSGLVLSIPPGQGAVG